MSPESTATRARASRAARTPRAGSITGEPLVPGEPAAGFQLIVETSIQGIWTLDRDGRTTFANAAMARLLATTPTDLMGRAFLDHVPDQFAGFGSDGLLGRIPSASVQRETSLRRADGFEVPVLATLSPIFGDGSDHDPTGALVMVTDLTDLREAERHIAFQARLLDSVGEAVIACDLHGRLQYYNPAAANLLGWSDDNHDRLLFDVLGDADRQLAQGLIDDVLRGGVSVSEANVTRPDRSVSSALLKGALVHDDRGEANGIIAVIVDLEERRRAELQAIRRAAEQSAAARLSETALRDTPVRDLLDDATRTLAEILGADYTTVFLFDDDHPDQLRLASAHGTAGRRLLTGAADEVLVPILGSVAGRALTQRAPAVCHADDEIDPLPMFGDGSVAIASSMVGTIEGPDEAFGVIGTHSLRRREFTRDDELFVQTLGNVIAAAIMRERAEAALIEAEEAERRRIAEAVHDDTLQIMIAVALRLETLQKSSDDEVLQERIGELVQDTRLAAGRLRSLAFDLYPEDLAQGLEPVVRRLLEDTAATIGIDFDLSVELPKIPPVPVARTLYRNIQESIVNVRKHAKASHVSVRIWTEDDGTAVQITDDGVGIPAVAANGGAHGHLGVKGLRERTQRVGGRIRIERGVKGGTFIELWVPNTPALHED